MGLTITILLYIMLFIFEMLVGFLITFIWFFMDGYKTRGELCLITNNKNL